MLFLPTRVGACAYGRNCGLPRVATRDRSGQMGYEPRVARKSLIPRMCLCRHQVNLSFIFRVVSKKNSRGLKPRLLQIAIIVCSLRTDGGTYRRLTLDHSRQEIFSPITETCGHLFERKRKRKAEKRGTGLGREGSVPARADKVSGRGGVWLTVFIGGNRDSRPQKARQTHIKDSENLQ